MKKIALAVFLLLIGIHPIGAQKKHNTQKKPVYVKPVLKKNQPEINEMPPLVKEVEALEGSNTSVVDYRMEKYEGDVAVLENKCLDAFYEKDSISKQKMLKDLLVYTICKQTVEEYVRKFADTCNATKQIPIRENHFNPVCKILTTSKSTGKNTLFVMDYVFEKKKYLEENAQQGKTKGIVIPCTLRVELDAYYRDVTYSSSFFSKCIQEVLQ